jgi:ribulose-bisphosphate carboxylase small chain
MRITQGAFSFLADLSDEQIEAQLRYALRNGWAIIVEYTDDPHPRNGLWELWGTPRFDLAERESDVAMADVRAARAAFPHAYVKVVCYDRSLGRQTTALSFIVGRPPHEPGFRLERQEHADRQIRYSLHAYSADAPAGARYA